MESQRLILFFIFSFSLFMLVDAWQRDQNPPQPKPAASAPTRPRRTTRAHSHAHPVVEKLAAACAVPAATQAPAPSMRKARRSRWKPTSHRARSACWGAICGGSSSRSTATSMDRKANFVLFEQRPEHIYIAQSGLTRGPSLPKHRTTYTAGAAQYKLAEGASELEVRLQAPASNGVQVTKIYRFHRGSYLIDVSLRDRERGQRAALSPTRYFQLLRDGKPPGRRFGDAADVSRASRVYTDKRKVSEDRLQRHREEQGHAIRRTASDGWIAIIQHYFLERLAAEERHAARVLLRRAGQRLNAAGVIVPVGTRRAGRDGDSSRCRSMPGRRSRTSSRRSRPGWIWPSTTGG